MPIDRDFADTHEAPVEGIPLSLYPDYTVGPGITPGQQPHLQLVAGLRAMPLTAGGESHPALKQTF